MSGWVAPGWLGPVFLALAGPVAILLAALIAWKTQRRINTDRATIDFIATHEVGNPEWRRALVQFHKIVAHPSHPTHMIEAVTPKDSDQIERRQTISSVLGHFEAVAVAIKHGILSEVIYKDWNRTNYVRAWLKAQSYVTAVRETKMKQSAFEHFEELARTWELSTDTAASN